MNDSNLHFTLVVGAVVIGVIAYALMHPGPDSQKMLGELAMAVIVGKAAVTWPGGGAPPTKPA